MSFNNQYTPGFGQLPLVTKNLLIINFLLFFFTFVLQKTSGIELNNYLSLHYHTSPDFKPHQWITYIFMHGNLGHLLSNSIGLFMLGPLLELTWGSKRFLIFYIVCGYGAAVPEYIIEHFNVMNHGGYGIVILGASGALYGMMGAAAFLFGNMEVGLFFIPIRLPLKYMITAYIVLEIIGGIRGGDGVGHYAHMGGLIVGLATVLTLYRK